MNIYIFMVIKIIYSQSMFQWTMDTFLFQSEKVGSTVLCSGGQPDNKVQIGPSAPVGAAEIVWKSTQVKMDELWGKKKKDKDASIVQCHETSN